MDSGAIAGIAIAVIIFFIAGLIFAKSIYIVQQAEAIVVERLGRFHRILTPGVSFVVPFIDSPRTFTWRATVLDPSGEISEVTTNSCRIDLRESVFNFLRQEVFTKDTVYVDVNSIMYYRIYDVHKAVYEVEDLLGALCQTAQTQLKEVFGNMTFSQALASQKSINEHLVKEFSKVFAAWGIHVERMELLDLQPNMQTQAAMKKQMVAERTRRGEFIRSEGRKAAMRLTAEGTKVVKLNMGLAEQEATRKRSEGEKEARIELARAESTALEVLAENIKSDGSSNVEYMIAQRFMELFRSISDSSEDKLIYLPYDSRGLQGIIGHLPGVFGRGASYGSGVMAAPHPKTDEFSELN
eukprot:CAMPEP_0114561102 /NCGR_PEP_ID=MMETSP0114-20121206/11824_1 /TAXON_ID=31324 /ORGANISM="Goniomonas sp, Strain m" /LENGTH=353 /DNA_ID=CAMNT_0001746713 /DNA_START=16 /DNA_END=1077 /DNA_ORIENTATION=-